MNRRRLIQLPVAALVAGLGARAWSRDATALLKAGGCGVMMRHALTVPGFGDPPEFEIGRCATQRNLSDAGREQSSRIGQWFHRHALEPRHVYSSQWCRCRETAQLAFGRYEDLLALNSTFAGRGDPGAQVEALRAVLTQIPAGRFDVFVTHQVNITALTGSGTAMGEALIVERDGTVLGRLSIG